MPLVAWW